MTDCTLCGKKLDSGVTKCGYCGRPAPTYHASSKSDSIGIWGDLNALTKLVIFLFIISAIISNVIVGTIIVLIGFFLFAPWTADYARRHHRSMDWGYFWGFLGLITIAIYWVYVQATRDP